MCLFAMWQQIVPCAIHVDLGAARCPLHRAHEHTHAVTLALCLCYFNAAVR